MTERVPPPSGSSKDEKQARLAEHLRANLHRRKAQARAMALPDPGSVPVPVPDPAQNTDLSKS